MCRTTDYHGFDHRNPNSLRIKAFKVRFSGFPTALPEVLTLIYLPRVSQTELFVDGSKVRPGSTAFLTLHRVVNVKTEEGEAVFWCREPVRASDGARFEVYLGGERVLAGGFRRNEEEDDWKLECECGLENGSDVKAAGAAVEITVAVEGRLPLTGRVEMVLKRRKRNRRRFDRLKVILEEVDEVIGDESDGRCWCDCEDGGRSDGEDMEEMCGPDCKRMEVDLEGVRWAVDLGLWVIGFGVGYMVSKASARSLRRLRLF